MIRLYSLKRLNRSCSSSNVQWQKRLWFATPVNDHYPPDTAYTQHTNISTSLDKKSVLPFHTQDCYPFCNCVTEMHLPFLLPMQLPTPSTLQSLESNRLFICSVIYISLRSNVSLVNRTSIGKSRFDPLIFSLCDEVSCRIRCCLFVLFLSYHS